MHTTKQDMAWSLTTGLRLRDGAISSLSFSFAHSQGNATNAAASSTRSIRYLSQRRAGVRNRRRRRRRRHRYCCCCCCCVRRHHARACFQAIDADTISAVQTLLPCATNSSHSATLWHFYRSMLLCVTCCCSAAAAAAAAVIAHRWPQWHAVHQCAAEAPPCHQCHRRVCATTRSRKTTQKSIKHCASSTTAAMHLARRTKQHTRARIYQHQHTHGRCCALFCV